MGKVGRLWDKNNLDIRDPEVMVTGVGRMRYSQLKTDIIHKLEGVMKFARAGEFQNAEFVLRENQILYQKILAAKEIQEEVEEIAEFVKKFKK